jgi:uncharacterized protein with von Willebrand factor type A (vWA) domain
MTLPKSEPYSHPEIDRVLLGFAHTLSSLGIQVDQNRVQTLYRAVLALGSSDRDHVYLAGKLSFCSRKEHLPIYDRAFEAWFGGLLGVTDQPNAARSERAILVGVDLGEAALDQGPHEKPVASASAVEFLREADIALLSPTDRALVEGWIAKLRPAALTRRSRRFEIGGSDFFDRRKTVRAALKAGGEVSDIFLRDRRRTPRRVLFLIDISGSMRAYASAYLQFAYATKRSRRSTEVFTIGTRLTRVTRSLSESNVERAINLALRDIPDWSGGTRLGSQLRSFIRDFGARSIARGAIVVIASDGWERGDVQMLGDGVAHLSRLAKRIIWVNPHMHRPGFAPLTAGMEIALPHLDRLVSGHSFNSFDDLCHEIADSR